MPYQTSGPPRHKWISDLLDNPPDKQTCWPWPGPVNRKTGRPSYTSLPMEMAVRCGHTYTGHPHRLVYLLMRGPIPEGLTLDHLCENKACVNPWHLDPVPQAENTRRYWATRFGHVRRLPSGNYQASYMGDGRRHTAPSTFATEAEARDWLGQVRRGA